MTRESHTQADATTTGFAIDLSPRQAARTLEQAVRHHASLELVSREQPDDPPLLCRLETIEETRFLSGRQKCLVVIPHSRPDANNEAGDEPEPPAADADADPDRYSPLLATYCDVTLMLGEHRYLFSTDVVGLRRPTQTGGPVRLYLTYPAAMQVAQRRRHSRFHARHAAQVSLRWRTENQGDGLGVAWLYNLGPTGIACRAEGRVADQLCIGEQLQIEFALAPGDPQRFLLDAVLCNKTPAGSSGKMILGMQFLTGEGHDHSARTAEALRRELLVRFAKPIAAPEGAGP